MIEVVNRQRKIKLFLNNWRDFAEKAVAAVPPARGKSLTVAFVSDRKMLELNRFFRKKNRTTDVLSFPFEPDEFAAAPEAFPPASEFLGDLVISAEQAEKQAKENNLDLETEIKQLILHGILHLCGYDHETDAGEMNALEIKLRDKLRIS